MTSSHRTDNYFTLAISLICIAYFIFEYFYVNFAAFVVDEFVFARQIYEYTYALPYRDFLPYKGVLGNYLLSPAMYLSGGMVTSLFLIKTEIAAINTVCIALTAYWSKRFFDTKAIVMALLAVLVNHQMLLLSADLRVDMLSSWLCLFACLALLGQRARVGGILIGIAFLISQKAIWYVFAINGSLMLCWLVIPNTVYNFRTLVRFNLYVATTIAAYVIFWSILVSPAPVFQTLFYEGYLQAGIDWYTRIYAVCWQITLLHGPILFLCWPLALIPLFNRASLPSQYEKYTFIVVLSSLALLQFIFYKQPFPYNFVFVIPAFFLLYSSFFTWLFSTNNKELEGWFRGMIVTVMIALGIVYPLIYSFISAPHYNNQYQQEMLRLASELTNDGSDYVAGIPLLYRKDQPVNGMKNLIGPQIDYLYQPTDKLGKILLTSLYLSKTTQSQIINELEIYPVKIIITNYRINVLPPLINNYIASHYQRFYGSIYLYAPSIQASALTFHLKFSGNYKVESSFTSSIKLDSHVITSGMIVHLKRGDHFTSAKHAYRLVLIPALKQRLNKDKGEHDIVRAITI